MIESSLTVGPFQCNCRILVCERTYEAAIIDPGDESEMILTELKALEERLGHGIDVKYLLQTHGHLDHIGASRDVKTARTGQNQNSTQIALHRDDLDLYQGLKMQGQLFGMQYEAPLPVDFFLEHEMQIEVGLAKIDVIHTPGHSPGGICLKVNEDSANQVKPKIYTGDTLFRDSVGRTDLWGADAGQLTKSIKQRLFALDDDWVICPGHGPESTLGREKRSNPFVGSRA